MINVFSWHRKCGVSLNPNLHFFEKKQRNCLEELSSFTSYVPAGIPLNDTLVDYREYAIRLVFSIAELYALNKWDLLDLLSQRIEDIQKDIELRKEWVHTRFRACLIWGKT